MLLFKFVGPNVVSRVFERDGEVGVTGPRPSDSQLSIRRPHPPTFSED